MAVVAAPHLNIPSSDSTCKIFIIDTTCRVKVPVPIMMMPYIAGHDLLDCPSHSFLIENVALGRRVLFDLGVRKDWRNLAPSVLNTIKHAVSLHVPVIKLSDADKT